MTDLTFVEELPGIAHAREKTQERAAALRSRPGEWARWPSASSTATVKKSLGEGFEVVGRTVDGKVRTFARFVAERPAAGPPPQFLSRHVGCRNHVMPDLQREPQGRSALWSGREGPGAVEASHPQCGLRLGVEAPDEAEMTT